MAATNKCLARSNKSHTRRNAISKRLVGHAAVLPRLHAGAASRPRASSTRACSRSRATTCARSSAAARATRTGGVIDGDLARRDDRYSELRSAATRRCRRSRCSRWAAERRSCGRAPALSSTAFHRSTNWWTALRRLAPDFVDNRVDPSPARPYRRSCPKGPTGSKEPRSHQGPSLRRRSLRALRCPLWRASHHGRRRDARRDVIGIPVSILPSGRRSRGPRPSLPWTRSWRPACRRPAPTRRRSAAPRSDATRSRRPRSRPASTRSRRPSARAPTLVPEVGIVLGSGLGGLADDLDDAVAIPFAELPGWPAATAPGARRPAVARAARRPAGGHAPGPLPPVRGQRPGPRDPAGPAVRGWARGSSS